MVVARVCGLHAGGRTFSPRKSKSLPGPGTPLAPSETCGAIRGPNQPSPYHPLAPALLFLTSVPPPPRNGGQGHPADLLNADCMLSSLQHTRISLSP